MATGTIHVALRLILFEETGIVARDGQRIGTDRLAQLSERHLGVQPFWIFGYFLHGGLSIVTNEVDPVTEDDKSLETGAYSMPGKLEVADVVIRIQQPSAQRTEVAGKVFQKVIVARAGVKENTRLVLRQ